MDDLIAVLQWNSIAIRYSRETSFQSNMNQINTNLLKASYRAIHPRHHQIVKMTSHTYVINNTQTNENLRRRIRKKKIKTDGFRQRWNHRKEGNDHWESPAFDRMLSSTVPSWLYGTNCRKTLRRRQRGRYRLQCVTRSLSLVVLSNPSTTTSDFISVSIE